MVRNLEKIEALKRWVVELVVLGGEEVGVGWERQSMWQWLGFLRRTKKEDEREEREEREYFLPVSRDPLTMILLLVQRKTEVKANERGERGGFKEKEKLGRLVQMRDKSLYAGNPRPLMKMASNLIRMMMDLDCD